MKEDVKTQFVVLQTPYCNQLFHLRVRLLQILSRTPEKICNAPALQIKKQMKIIDHCLKKALVPGDESNCGMEIEDAELLEKGARLLHHPEDLKKAALKEEGNSLCISMSVMYGCPVRFNINLTVGSKELFFQKVTQKLLLTISDLRSSENKLRLLLQKKDKEIEEYKCEGGEIALRHLKTVPFNDEVHMQSHRTHEELFGSSGIDDSLLQERISKNLESNSSIKYEPTSVIKEEQSTEKFDSLDRFKKEEIVKSEPQSESQTKIKKQKRKLNI